MINLTIDGKTIEVKEGTTILEAARIMGIDIPTLCYLKGVHEAGECRICIVEVEGRRGFTTSCVQKCENGMVVRTNTPDIMDARSMLLDLTLSNHHKDCLTCIRSGDCELQSLAQKYNVQNIEYTGEIKDYNIDEVSPSIIRDLNKCILCRRCVAACNQIQNIGAISVANRGFDSYIATAGDKSLGDVNCTNCGQCIQACPTGALREKDDTKNVWRELRNPDKIVFVQTAPAVRVGLGEEFGFPIGTNVTGKMISALKKLGFDKVFDTNTGADLTIMEEGTEFIQRLSENKDIPMITSCSPGWIKYIEMNYPEQLKHLSSCKSPHQMFGAILKSYYANKIGKDPKNISVISIMPCIAKKFESSRAEMEVDGIRDVDFVLTTRELARMIKQANIEFDKLEDEKFDDPMGEATGAGVIFGTTGGVMEAALRTISEVVTGKTLEKIEFKDVRGEDGIRKAIVKIGDNEIKAVVAHGLSNAKKIMEEIKNGKSDYHFIEIMACPGGCVMGGGQPRHIARECEEIDIRKLRAEGLYNIDEKSKIRKSHENPVIKKLYSEFLEKPGSSKSHELLHTKYEKREKYT